MPIQEQLTEIVRRISAHYEVHPESTVLRDRTIRQIGFRVELYGRGGEDQALRPGDERCRDIYRGLREIALRALPEGAYGCRFEIGGFSPSVYYGNDRETVRGSVRLDVCLLHGDAWDRPVGAEENRALREIEDRLEDLGVHRH